jgi:hypothetical protein
VVLVTQSTLPMLNIILPILRLVRSAVISGNLLSTLPMWSIAILQDLVLTLELDVLHLHHLPVYHPLLAQVP